MSKNEDIRNVAARRRNILYLIQRYLQENAYLGAAAALKSEAQLSEDYELCDNIDLDAMYLEYASYYHLKLGKYPNILRKSNPSACTASGAKPKKPKPLTQHKETRPPSSEKPQNGDLQVTVTKLESHKEGDGQETLSQLREVDHSEYSGSGDELLHCSEWKNLADFMQSTILTNELKLSWNDMCGNQKAVDIIKEAVLVPLKYPKLFMNGLQPWKSVLLHGPPGSGKTMLAKILFAETRGQLTFFNITSSIVISKWRGESEKIVKVLFHLAQKRAPSIIFFDEIEGLTSKRDRQSDHEASKRFKNELLQLLDGMEQLSSGVFILASTNLPWDIDDAFLRRFEKKILVELPNPAERSRMISKLLPAAIKPSKDQLERLVGLSENFTGDEMRLACKEIAMQSIRRATRGKETAECSIEQAFEQIKPLSLNLMSKHVLWQKRHGQLD